MDLTLKNKELNTLYRVLDKIKITNMRANRGRAKLLAKVVDKINEYAKDETDLIDMYAAKDKDDKFVIDEHKNIKLADPAKLDELNDLLNELADEEIVIKGGEYSKRFIDFLNFLEECEDEFTSSEIILIDNILEQFKKSEYVEIAMGEAVQKVDDLEKISQETAKTAKTAQTAAGLAKVSAERTQKMINLQTIHMLTSGGKIDPDIYKGLLELIEPAKQGEYQAYDVFTVVDESHEDQAGEGNLVFVHVNEPFTYEAQTLKDLESEDKVTVIKYADLVKQD